MVHVGNRAMSMSCVLVTGHGAGASSGTKTGVCIIGVNNSNNSNSSNNSNNNNSNNNNSNNNNSIMKITANTLKIITRNNMRLPPLYMLQKCCKNVAKALTQSKNFLWRVFPFAAKSMPGILQPCLVHSCMQLDQKLFEEALPFRTKKHAWYTATMPGTRREPKGTQEERET